MKLFIIVLLTLQLSGCANLEYRPLSPTAGTVIGSGKIGDSVTVEGVEIWTGGAPPYAYRAVGFGKIASAGSSLASRRIQIARKVIEVNGDAGLEFDDGRNFGSIIPLGIIVYPASTDSTQFLIIRKN